MERDSIYIGRGRGGAWRGLRVVDWATVCFEAPLLERFCFFWSALVLGEGSLQFII